jgi:hypothetical protein
LGLEPPLHKSAFIQEFPPALDIGRKGLQGAMVLGENDQFPSREAQTIGFLKCASVKRGV